MGRKVQAGLQIWIDGDRLKNDLKQRLCQHGIEGTVGTRYEWDGKIYRINSIRIPKSNYFSAVWVNAYQLRDDGTQTSYGKEDLLALPEDVSARLRAEEESIIAKANSRSLAKSTTHQSVRRKWLPLLLHLLFGERKARST